MQLTSLPPSPQPDLRPAGYGAPVPAHGSEPHAAFATFLSGLQPDADPAPAAQTVESLAVDPACLPEGKDNLPISNNAAGRERDAETQTAENPDGVSPETLPPADAEQQIILPLAPTPLAPFEEEASDDFRLPDAGATLQTTGSAADLKPSPSTTSPPTQKEEASPASTAAKTAVTAMPPADKDIDSPAAATPAPKKTNSIAPEAQAAQTTLQPGPVEKPESPEIATMPRNVQAAPATDGGMDGAPEIPSAEAPDKKPAPAAQTASDLPGRLAPAETRAEKQARQNLSVAYRDSPLHLHSRRHWAAAHGEIESAPVKQGHASDTESASLPKPREPALTMPEATVEAAAEASSIQIPQKSEEADSAPKKRKDPESQTGGDLLSETEGSERPTTSSAKPHPRGRKQTGDDAKGFGDTLKQQFQQPDPGVAAQQRHPGNAAGAIEEAAAPEEIALEETSPSPDATGSDPDRVLQSNMSSEPSRGRARSAESSAAPRQPINAAWFRTLLGENAHSFSVENGWKVMEMKLEDGSGSMTIKARREEDKMAVAVGFSDPTLRAMAHANVDRLQEALQAQYETDVDLSLFGENAGNQTAQDQQQQASRSRHEGGNAPAGNLSPAARREPALSPGTLHEWIG